MAAHRIPASLQILFVSEIRRIDAVGKSLTVSCNQLFAHSKICSQIICLMTALIPCHTDRKVKTSTMLPWSVKGDSCKTAMSFSRPFCTTYSTIWLIVHDNREEHRKYRKRVARSFSLWYNGEAS